MTITVPPADDHLGRVDPGNWPLLGDSNYLFLLPAYTADLASKLANADAEVAAAVNAAADAQGALTAIAALVAGVPKIATGRVLLNFTGSNTASAAVSFPAGLFAAAPATQVSLYTGDPLGIVVHHSGRSNTGMTVRGTTGSGGSYAGSVYVEWLAIG